MADTLWTIVVGLVISVTSTVLVMALASVCSRTVAEWNLIVLLLKGRLSGSQREKWLEILSCDWEDAKGPRDRFELLVAATKIAANPRDRGPQLVGPSRRRQTSPTARVLQVEYLTRTPGHWILRVHFSDGTAATVTMRASRRRFGSGDQRYSDVHTNLDITYNCGWQSVMSASAISGNTGRTMYRLNEALREVLLTNAQMLGAELRGGDDAPDVVRVRPD